MFHPLSMLRNRKDRMPGTLEKDEIAKLLNTTPEALKAFEDAYRVHAMDAVDETDPFGVCASQAKPEKDGSLPGDPAYDALIGRIVSELKGQTEGFTVNEDGVRRFRFSENESAVPVTIKDLSAVPETVRPQLAGELMKKDLPGDSSDALLWVFDQYRKAKNPLKRKTLYGMFRRGLDTLDLDPLLYAMLGRNANSIEHWLPPLAEAAMEEGFFKIPKTACVRVPLPLLQLTRLEYGSLTEGSRDVLNRYCREVFRTDDGKDRFIRTGTHSGKFDFRNTHVTAGKEMDDLGEYLCYIHHQAVRMAGPLSSPSIYGMGTTRYWCVREYIENAENLPTIYKGLPLRTEFRVFADLDRASILGMSPYWRADVMERRFGHGKDKDSPHQVHDYVIYKAQRGRLEADYDACKGAVRAHVESLLPTLSEHLSGQWSIDVMKNGKDFWLIDMALADQSALSDCVPKGLLRPHAENWLPEIG